MSNGLPQRPSFPPLPPFRNEDLGQSWLDTHISRFESQPKPPLRIPKLHSAAGHRWRSDLRRTAVEFERQRRADAFKKKREEILYGKQQTITDRIAALPPPTHEPISPKPVLLNFDKLTSTDLCNIFTSKFEATLKRLEVFETFEFSDEVNKDHIKNLRLLIDRLTHFKRSLKDTCKVRSREEYQAWDFGLKQIGNISFKRLRKNQVYIVYSLSDVFRQGYFGDW